MQSRAAVTLTGAFVFHLEEALKVGAKVVTCLLQLLPELNGGDIRSARDHVQWIHERISHRHGRFTAGLASRTLTNRAVSARHFNGGFDTTMSPLNQWMSKYGLRETQTHWRRPPSKHFDIGHELVNDDRTDSMKNRPKKIIRPLLLSTKGGLGLRAFEIRSYIRQILI